MPNVTPSTHSYPTQNRPTLKPIEELLSPPSQQSAPQAQAPTQYQPTPAPAGSAQQSVSLVDTPSSTEVSPEELEWAVALEQKASRGENITEAELAKHTGIMDRLSAQRMDVAERAGVSNADFQWASNLEQQSAQGYQAQPAEVERYQAIAAKIQAYEGGGSAPAPTQQPAQPTQPTPAQQPAPQAGPQPTAPTPTDSGDVNLGGMALVKDKVDLTPKFESLSQITDQNYFMKQLEGFTAPEAVDQRKQQAREVGVQIWLEGDVNDRVRLSQNLVETGYADVVSRIMTHQETRGEDMLAVMKSPGFPVAEYMNALKDNDSFLILNSLSNQAIKGNADAANLIDQTVSAYDRMWDREAPFEQLRNQMQSNGTWQSLPAALQQRIDKLLN
jgi:hypothetical protein